MKASSLFSALLAGLTVSAGCGTTRWSDTQRTATEQFVISDSIDKAVGRLDFEFLAGEKVYFDSEYLEETVHRRYLVSSLRQQLLAGGCLLQEKREEADYVVEARSGVVGTDRDDVLLGVPQMQLPPVIPGVPSSIPEVPIIKKTNQVGAAKIVAFAYNRRTGKRLWQSGTLLADSNSKNLWFVGAGPIEWGSSREGTRLAGERLEAPSFARKSKDAGDANQSRPNRLTQAIAWEEEPDNEPVRQAGHNVAVELPDLPEKDDRGN